MEPTICNWLYLNSSGSNIVSSSYTPIPERPCHTSPRGTARLWGGLNNAHCLNLAYDYALGLIDQWLCETDHL
uniref:Uncharacterized protein n=1 Tax=Romanomermis culicivorax TaxID=13658 RepID=A0A915HXG4_ROMCU